MSIKILIIDDDELVLIAVEGLLGAEGYMVDASSSGGDALEKARNNVYDLFLLDLIMPGLSGFDVCIELRKIEQYQKTPIIMLTAKSAEADRTRGLESGATRFLAKPIDPEKLLEIISEELSQ